MASHPYDPVQQLQTSALTLLFGLLLISAGRMLRKNGRLPWPLDLGQKVSGSLTPREGRSAGVVRLGTGLVVAGGFFLFGTVCLVSGAMGFTGPR
ncbi:MULTISPECIES: hypothetical protein [unclassified Streptomyces]|uniref:hypothetical protein n=1 Tax=unclassified Streptomyces TaxID=2593676 RepID=UPI001331524A|nr:hypothetical protein [Streptomyces sp. SAT1]